MRRRITCCNIKVGHTQQSKEKSFQTLLRKTVVVGPAAATWLSRSRPTFSDTKVHRLCQKHMKSLRCFARVFASTFLHTVESLLATPLSSFYVLLIPYTFFCKIVNDHFETLPKTHEHWRFILMVSGRCCTPHKRWCLQKCIEIFLYGDLIKHHLMIRLILDGIFHVKLIFTNSCLRYANTFVEKFHIFHTE